MDNEMTSKGLQLRIPLQAAPISRTPTGSVFAAGTGGLAVAARPVPPIDRQWCEEMGLPPNICRLIGGGGTGPTFPRS